MCSTHSIEWARQIDILKTRIKNNGNRNCLAMFNTGNLDFGQKLNFHRNIYEEKRKRKYVKFPRMWETARSYRSVIEMVLNEI